MTQVENTELVHSVQCDSGDVAIVKPLSPLAYQALVIEAERVYPRPDEKDYEQPLPNAAVEGLVIEAKFNPAYVAALRDVLQKQQSWIYIAVIQAGVVVDTEEGKQATMLRYLPLLKQLKSRVAIVDDPWLATVMYGVISTRQDIKTVVDAARGTLTQEEINSAVKSFRRPVQRRRPAGNPPDEVSPGTA